MIPHRWVPDLYQICNSLYCHRASENLGTEFFSQLLRPKAILFGNYL
jgi:hypothetical protein